MHGPPGDMIEALGGVAYKVDFGVVDAELAPYLTGVKSYHVRLPAGVHNEFFFPAWSAIRIQTYGEKWSIKLGDCEYDPVPPEAIFGPTSVTGFARVSTGQVVEINLLPRGWARLTSLSAHSLANRGADLSSILPQLSGKLRERLLSAGSFEEEARVFQDVLKDAIMAARPEPREIAQSQDLLLDPAIQTVESAVEALAIPHWRFARISKRYFGFTPKLLMRRARFMRTILQIRGSGTTDWASVVDEAYVDQSHFIRDCHDFLGMTPGQFTARFHPIAQAAFDAREKQMGNRHHLLPDAEA